MRILFLSTKSPLPMNDGHSIRTFHIMRILSEQHEIRLLSFVKFKEEYDHVNELKKYCSKVRLLDVPANCSKAGLVRTLLASACSPKPFVAHKYDTANMRREIREELSTGKIGLVHLDLAPLGCYMDMLGGQKVVLDAHNVESSLLKRRVENEPRPFHKLFWTLQQKRYEDFERRLAGSVSHILCCSTIDETEFRSFAPKTATSVISNGVDTDYFRPTDVEAVDPNKLLFIGGMDWFPNRDAIEWFDREIFALVLKAIPNARLHVIGRENGMGKPRHAGEIRFHGFVDDIRPLMGEAAALIVPLRIGGGTRMKILNAMAAGKPVVSTSIGAEGLGLTDGEDSLLADDPASFSKAVCAVMSDALLRGRIGQRARLSVEDRFAWGKISEKLGCCYQKATS